MTSRVATRGALGGLLSSALLGALAGGCWLSHGPATPDAEPPPGSDGGREAAADAPGEAAADAPADAPDAARDAEPDATPDADADARPPPPSPPPVPDRCRVAPAVYPFLEPELEFRWPAGEVTHPSMVHVCATPIVVDLEPGDDDRRPKLVFVSYGQFSRTREPGGILRIVDPRTGATISYPEDPLADGELAPTGHVAAADLDGDGSVEIVAAGQATGTVAFRADGTPWWRSPYPLARDRGDPAGRFRTIGPAPAIADLEGDGTPEVVLGRTVLDGSTGALRWNGEGETGIGINVFLGPISCVADLDGDGRQEVIAGPTVFRADGEVVWNRFPEVPDGLCAVADVLSEPAGPEVVLVAEGNLWLLAGRDGRTLWRRVLEGRVRAGVGGAPTVADFDGDGRVEIGVAHGAAYGVYDPACTAPDTPRGCLGEGLLWKARTDDASSSGTGSSVFDFNGDGRAEVIYNDERTFRIYDGTSGAELFRWRNSSRTRTENPAIADVDDDGDAEIVFSANAEAFFIREWWTDPGVEVWGNPYGRWVGARRIWNQHAYHVTNIEEDGSVPRREVPSWTTFNSYRQNIREDGDVLAAPDLWGGRGSVRCEPDGAAVLRVLVANWGIERAGEGLVVGFYEGRPTEGGVRLGQARTPRSLGPRGDAVTVTFRVERPRPGAIYWAWLDDPSEAPPTGHVAECLEDNNEVWIGPADCSR